MAQRFRKLRTLLRNADIGHRYLAELLGKSTSYISPRMTAKTSWKLDEAYKILEILNEPLDMIYEIFPKDGISNEVHEYRDSVLRGEIPRDDNSKLPLLPPIHVGKIGRRNVFITISYQ